MAITQATQSVTDTATKLGTGRGGRKLLMVRNPSASGATVYIGGSGVTSSNALIELPEGANTLSLSTSLGDSLAGEDWYVVCATGQSATIAVGEG